MNQRRALAFIFCTVTLDILAFGLMAPVLPRLVLSFLGSDTARAAQIYGLFGTVWGLMQFVGRVISGITAATISTATAYIADVTPPEGRARAFGLIGVAFGLAFIVGPAMGGLLASIDLRLPFWVSAFACLLNAAFGWLVLPESLPPERRMAFSWKRANPVGAMRLLVRQGELIGLAAANFLGQLAHHVLPSVFVLYASYRYAWGASTVGLTLALVGACAAVVQGLLVGPVVARFGERRAMLSGLAFGALGMAIFAWAPSGALFCVGVPVMALWGLAGPSLQGLMSRLVSGSEQGQLQGANTSLVSITGLFGPALFTFTFAHFVDSQAGANLLSGAAFLLSAAILVAALGVSWAVTRKPPAAGQPA